MQCTQARPAPAAGASQGSAVYRSAFLSVSSSPSHPQPAAFTANKSSSHPHFYFQVIPTLTHTTVAMRYSFAIFAAVAAAAPQVQPISQISDGQIQAPPATPAPGYSVTQSAIIPGVTPISNPVLSASVPAVTPPGKPSSHLPPLQTSIANSTPAPVVPSNTPVAPVPTMVSPIVPGVNSTVPTGTGIASKASSALASATSGAASASGSSPAQATGAAGSNFVSFGGLMVAVGAAMLA